MPEKVKQTVKMEEKGGSIFQGEMYFSKTSDILSYRNPDNSKLFAHQYHYQIRPRHYKKHPSVLSFERLDAANHLP